MSVCLCTCKIANKSHRKVKVEWYLNSGSDSISCSLIAAVTEMYLFFLLCRFGFSVGEWFLLVFWGEFCSLVGFLFGFFWVFFYRLVFSTCVLDKLVIFSLKKKFYYSETSDKFIFVPSQPIYSICLHLTSLLTSSVIWAFFQTY